MKTSIPRLRRIRYKDGRTLDVFPTKSEGTIERRLRKAMAAAMRDEGVDPMLGYAVVAWYKSGDNYSDYSNDEPSPLMAGQVPQYVKDILLAEYGRRR